VYIKISSRNIICKFFSFQSLVRYWIWILVVMSLLSRKEYLHLFSKRGVFQDIDVFEELRPMFSLRSRNLFLSNSFFMIPFRLDILALRPHGWCSVLPTVSCKAPNANLSHPCGWLLWWFKVVSARSFIARVPSALCI